MVIGVVAALTGGVAVLGGVGATLSPIALAVGKLYGIGGDINGFIDAHLALMKASDSEVVSRTGSILEAAKFGFGLGYISSVTVIAIGQYLLGNTLAAVSAVATAATLTNPVAMTCAAVGAIIYGWAALKNDERRSILETLASGLQIGVELIKAMVDFVIRTAGELMDAKLLKQFKQYITEKAALFGRSLADVTHLTVDALSGAAATVKRQSQVAYAETARLAGETSEKVGSAVTELAKVAGDAIGASGDAARKVVEGSKDLVKRRRDDQPSG
jgi:hypothetical protein